MSKQFDPVKYKEELKKDWSDKASLYHEHYVAPRAGPFQSVTKLIEAANLHEGQRVLDVGTGTGIVAMEALKKVGKSGKVVGIDLSAGTLKIAKKEMSDVSNVEFIEMDAEDLKFHNESFDVALSEFALFFFPDVQKALSEIRRVLVKKGRLAISVHGSEEKVPYLSSISSSILHYIPDIRPSGTPNPYRFGKPEALRTELEKCNFRNIELGSYTYTYVAGTFDDYWSEFMSFTANAIRERLAAVDPSTLERIRSDSKRKAEKFLKQGVINFPWEVLTATANI